MNEQLLRSLPRVDVLCQSPELELLRTEYGEKALVEAVRQVLSQLRQGILDGTIEALPADLHSRIQETLIRRSLPSLRPVINGTGIILHTNLGRACLSDRAAWAVYDVARQYSNLEYDIPSGSRGSRSVKRLAADRGLSFAERDRLPVLRMDGCPVVIPGIGVNEKFTPDENQGSILVTFIKKTEENKHEK